MNSKVCESMLHNSPIGCAYVRAIAGERDRICDFEILFVNPALEELVGAEGRQILGRRITGLVPRIREMEVDWIDYYAELAREGGNREFTYYSEKLDKWLRVRAYSPQEYYLVLFIHDISQEVRQIRELDTLFKVSPDLLCILGADYRIARVNRAFEQFFGKKAEELVGRDFLSLTCPWDLEYTREKLQALAAREEPVKFVNRMGGLDGSFRYMEWHGLPWGSQLYLAARDITHSRLERAYFEALFLHSTDAMLYFDEETKIFNLNKQFTDLFGYTLEELQGLPLSSIFPPDPEMPVSLSRRILQGETVALETVRPSKSGRLIPVSVKGGPVYIDGEIKGGFAVYTDISERKAYEEHLKRLSLHDQLTGLYNRHFLETQIKIIEKSKRYPISVLVFDVDGLKLVNDTLGHAQGDKLLQMVANVISKSLRASDFLARIGGDEFIAVLPETDEETVFKIADRIRANIRKANETCQEFPISVSVGAATAVNHHTTLEETIRKADERMYHEKLVEKRGTKGEMLAFLLRALGEINAARQKES